MPPAGEPVKASDDPIHTALPPEMVDEPGVTVTVRVVKQLPTAYVITAVPADIPVTTPEALIEAMAVALQLHEPPAGVAVRAVVEPIHIVSVPEITGVAVIVIVFDA